MTVAGSVDVAEVEPPAGDEAPGARLLVPVSVQRWRDLPWLESAACWSVLIVLAALPVISAVVVLIQGWHPSGDVALIGIRVNDILRGRPALVGQPTTGENFGSGIAGSHPGPIEFYLLAPFVAVLGSTIGMALGAAAINAASLGATVWLAVRRGGMLLAALTGAALALMLRSLEGNLIHDAVSSNVGTLPTVLTMFAAWAIVAGDLRVAPLFVAAGSFALQDHLTYLGTVGPVVGLGLVAGVLWIRSSRRHGTWAEHARAVWASAVVGVVLWLPVVLDELIGDHNLNRTWRTFTGGRTAGSGLAFAIGRVQVALAPVPVFARRIDPLGYLAKPTSTVVWLALAVGAWAAAVTAVALRRRQTALLAPLAVAWVAVLAGLLSAMKLPVDAGIQASNLRWMWTTGALVWIVLCWTTWRLLPPRERSSARLPICTVAWLLLVWGAAGTLATVNIDTDRDGRIMASLPDLYRTVRAEVPEGRYAVQYSGPSAAGTVGPGLVHHLDEHGYTIFVDSGAISRAYTARRVYAKQPVDGVLLVTTDARLPYSDEWQLVARQELELDQGKQRGAVVRVLRRTGSP